jgi:hypothetical protein
MKKLNFTIATIAAVTLIGCGGGGGSSSGDSDSFKIETVKYSIENNKIICNKPSSQTISKAQESDDYGVASCIWLCGSYEGASPVLVSLSFEQDGKDAPWTFDGDSVSTASSQCHN